MKQTFTTLLENIVTPNYCVGCGVCVSMCNFETIDMQFNSLGQYEPYYKNESSCTACGLCVKVCPFENKNDNEDIIGERKFASFKDMKHEPEIGYYLQSYVGYADEKTRMNGASGGGVSQLLKWLLKEGKIDKVITVESTTNPDKLFQYTIVDTPEDIDRCAKSAYYPVEVSRVLEEARKSKDTRYAIVGLPCALKAVENAKKVFPKLKRSILYSIGIVCGQTKSKKYAEYLIRNLGVEQEDVQSVVFRRKVSGYRAGNFAFEVKDKHNNTTKQMWHEGVRDIWVNDFFKQKSCYHCDDVFAECGDIVFLDAWLPEYSKDYQGTNLVINRSEDLQPFFTVINSYDSIEASRVIQSQVKVLENKRGYRALYDAFAKEGYNYVPLKRFFSTNQPPSRHDDKLHILRYQWAEMSLVKPFVYTQSLLSKVPFTCWKLLPIVAKTKRLLNYFIVKRIKSLWAK